MKPLLEYKALTNFVDKEAHLKIHNNELICIVCNKKLNYNPDEGTSPIKRHFVTKAHNKNARIFKDQESFQNMHGITVKNKKFDEELVEAFLSANISLNKLQNPVLNMFLTRYTKNTIYDESHYRKNTIPHIYAKQQKSIFNKLRNEPLYLIFDETTDSQGRYILNILGGICSITTRQKPFLIKTVELDRTNAQTVNQQIMNLLIELYNGVIIFENLWLILSDMAPYAVKAVKMLKPLFPNLKHVTCLCHMLHRICEAMRTNSPTLNLVASELKRILVKNKENQEIFNKVTTMKLPKFPIITRWGTWLQFVVYVGHNFVKIRNFLIEISKTNNIQSLIEKYESKLFEEEMKIAIEHEFLVLHVKKLEADSLSTKEQINTIREIKEKLSCEILKVKMNDLCKKNTDFDFFDNLNFIRCTENQKIYQNVPLTTVDVERSFSNLKYIFDDRRQNLSVENLGMLLALYYNK